MERTDTSSRLERTSNRLERSIVRHCAPTLAALKPANLFTFDAAGADDRSVATALAVGRARLAASGVYVSMLARRRAGPLLYVHRPDLVIARISEARTAAYLERDGYDVRSLRACLRRLRGRIAGERIAGALSQSCAFPHEIGFFLGYPFDDVVAFIENGGANEIVCGCWKVYSARRDAEECFCRYKTCTARYVRMHEAGAALEELAVAGGRAADTAVTGCGDRRQVDGAAPAQGRAAG